MNSKMKPHPSDPRSNILKVGGYDPDKYYLDDVTLTTLTHEDITPNRPPFLIQNSIGMYLRPLTKELREVPLRPSVKEISDAVIERKFQKEKALWADRPGENAYAMHEAFDRYNMKSEKMKPNTQSIFPRSCQYDLDCVTYRQRHACDGIKKDPTGICGDCTGEESKVTSSDEHATSEKNVRKRWCEYADLSATRTFEELKQSMANVGRPFKTEACKWYNDNYPLKKIDIIFEKFSK